VIASADPTSICEGETSTLTADGASTYSWSHSLGSGSSKTVAPSITTIYSVTGTSTAGCTNTASVTVTVNLLPTVTASADPTSICEGEISTLTAGGASNYSWSHSLGSGAIKTVTPNSTTTYTVTGTNTEGCTGTTTVSVTVNPNADATINPVGNLCDNQSLIILTAATPGGLWSGEGITIPSTGAFSPANVGTGTYTITYMISGQCGDTATIDITVYSSPEVTAYATDESCFNGNDGQAWVEVTNGTPPYTYLWNTYHTISNLNDLAPGVYHVTVTDTHNCSDRDTVIINPGIGDCYQTHIYVPNIFAPDGRGNAENEYLRVYGKGIKDLDFKIFDRWGNEVFHTTDINVGWDGTYKGQPALAGDYTYMLRVTYYNGNNESLKGHIYLIR
jgi:gliding motility-associated-like protein